MGSVARPYVRRTSWTLTRVCARSTMNTTDLHIVQYGLILLVHRMRSFFSISAWMSMGGPDSNPVKKGSR